QVNVCERGRDDDLLPTSLFRMVRELEPPADDEGFSAIERVPFVRAPVREHAGLIVSGEAARYVTEWTRPALVVGWQLGATPTLPEGVELAVCEHEAGPPRCWCRPPLPGLAVAWAKRHGVELTRCRFIGSTPTAEKLARALGATYLPLGA
ncbi:MAG: hypothetical protein JNK82_17310, partial [Myxococcaceae bacterium]|nr:hypothetical protein [Myxococcaceae bacterium]